MSNLVNEIVLRLAKAGAVLLLAIVVFWVATAVAGEPASVTLFLLSWLSAATFVLVVEESPI